MNLIARLLCLLLLVGLCLSAQPYQVKTTIPFQFEAANMVLPAGDYTIERMRDAPNLAILWLENRTAKAYLATFPVTLANSSEKEKSHLAFRRYGNGGDARYFLSAVWTDAEGSRLHKSRSERDAESAVMIAGQTPETVVIYARR
jgi:hypothetical protein